MELNLIGQSVWFRQLLLEDTTKSIQVATVISYTYILYNDSICAHKVNISDSL